MKILAIGRNYAAHIEELSNERPTEPVVFMKPDTALLENDAPFYYPDFSTDIHFEVELLLKISRTGKVHSGEVCPQILRPGGHRH